MNNHTVSLQTLHAYTRADRSLVCDCGGPQIIVTLLTPRIIRIRLSPDGAWATPRSWAVARADETFAEVAYRVTETDKSLVIQTFADEEHTTPVLSVHIQRDPLRVAFQDAQGQEFCADGAGGMQWDEMHTIGAEGWHVACEKQIAPDEHFFGFGERTSMLDRRGRQMTNWTTDPGSRQGPTADPLYIAIPVFLSLRPGLAYGLFFNTTWHSHFDMGYSRDDIWRMETSGGELDYYVIYGPTPQDVSAGIGTLLGTMPLPPRWALGYHQCRWSYGSEETVRTITSEFRKRAIPCDVIHFDIAYMDGYRVFTWDNERFPDPPRLLADLRQQGFRAVTIIDPGVKVDPHYHVYQQGIEQSMFIRRANGEIFQGYVWPDDSVFSDYTRTDVRQWWGDLQQRLVEQGVSGIWNDMNEPPVFDQPFSQAVTKRTWHTIDLDAPQGAPDEATTHAEVHNMFGSEMAQASYEGLRRHLGNERPFVLTRSGFAGVQRWSACWMGDNSSVWEHLEMAMPQLMNMGLSGVSFVGVDIGGFAGNANPELFARWMQCGALTPFCRGHTTHFSRNHEPWAFSPQVEEICRTYLNLRYQLMPYIYTLFWQATQHGTPVMRPLLYHFPNDRATYQIHDQFLLGPFLMVAPVYHPGRTSRTVYLPAGVWYDWWTGEHIVGEGHTILAHAPLETLPLYVRAGAIIPSGPAVCYTDEQPLAPLTLDIYPGDGEVTLYEDDGHTFAYEQGQYATTPYRVTRDNNFLTIYIGKREGSYTPPQRQLILRVHAVDKLACAVHPDATYDTAQRVVTYAFPDDGHARELVFRLR